MKYKNVVLLIIALFVAFPWACGAQELDGNDPLADLFSDTPEFLPEEQAFQFDFVQRNDQLIINFNIADGYYLYKKQIKTVTKDATVGDPVLPTGVEIEDEFFGVSEVYYEQLVVTFPILRAKQDGSIKLRYQGCAEAGLCYPPTTRVIYLDQVGDGAAEQSHQTAADSGDEIVSQQFGLADRLSSDEGLMLTLLLFLALGIGLAFTPCVFPMYPILSVN